MEIATADSEGDVGRYPALVIDENNSAYISCYEMMSNTSGYIKVAKWDGGLDHGTYLQARQRGGWPHQCL